MEAFREAAPYLDLGWRIAVTLVLFTGGGFLLDRHWGTLPWLTLVGGLLGIGSVFAQLFRLVEKLNEKKKNERGTSSESPDQGP